MYGVWLLGGVCGCGCQYVDVGVAVDVGGCGCQYVDVGVAVDVGGCGCVCMCSTMYYICTV